MKLNASKISLLAAMLAPAIVSTGVICTSCNNGENEPTKRDSTVHLLSINDFHGAAVPFGEIEQNYQISTSYHNFGIERIADWYEKFLQKNPATMFLSAGDNNSGDCFSTVLHAQTLYPLLKALGIRYSAVGNHAFEWGKEYLTGKTEDEEREHDSFDNWARTDYTNGNYFIASNIVNGDKSDDDDSQWQYESLDDPNTLIDYLAWKRKRVQWADPYKVIHLGGHDICLIGLTTKATREDGNQNAIKDLGFISYPASVFYAKELAKEQLGDDYNKIESFVLLTHVESDFLEDAQKQFTIVDPESTCAKLAKELTTDVDAIISGHSHKEGAGVIHNDVLNKDIWIGQALTAGRRILDTSIDFKYDAQGKLTKTVNMQVHIPSLINREYKEEELEQARLDIEDLRLKASTLSTGSIVRKVCEAYETQRQVINAEFKRPVGNATTLGIKYEEALHRQALGHEYIWPCQYLFDNPGEKPWLLKDNIDKNYLVEQMGAWANYASIKGFHLLPGANRLPTPYISFQTMDSLTHEFVNEGTAEKRVTKGDIYQLLTYENTIVHGYLTISQLCNIINYITVGERQFKYRDDTQYKEKASLTKNFITGQDYPNLVLPDDFKLRYLCGPLQFYGMGCTIRNYKGSDKQEIGRDWELQYGVDDIYKTPSIKIWNPLQGDTLEDPSTWTDFSQVKGGLDVPIPVIISSFVYGGGNDQNTIFKTYMEYNARQSEGYLPVTFLDSTIFARDPILQWLLTITKDKPNIDLNWEKLSDPKNGLTPFVWED